jgi:hypothetical protein
VEIMDQFVFGKVRFASRIEKHRDCSVEIWR